MDQKHFYKSVFTIIDGYDPKPSFERMVEIVETFKVNFGYEGPIDAIIEDLRFLIDREMGMGVSLVSNQAQHDPDWVNKADKEGWIYSEAYDTHLQQEKFSKNIRLAISGANDKILSFLHNPKSEGQWDIRGLVIGNVQSGKTANYISLVTKAADAGYRFIIVIAGIHNNLRKQTQQRVEEGFVGRSTDPNDRKLVGVGRLIDNYPQPATLTSVINDFQKSKVETDMKIRDHKKPVVLVIKKNVSTLKNLLKWLSDVNAQNDGQISDIPMLMIDDEADNASINTNSEDHDPTMTNRKIRDILRMFDKSCYIGYTATPFANIFINPDSYDDKVRKDLFPKDFIYSLDTPEGYFGPQTVFMNEETSRRIVKEINDAEDIIPLKHKVEDINLEEMPPSLVGAIQEFILVRAIRNLRGQSNKHCSMLVNISRFVAIQNDARNFIKDLVDGYRKTIKANYAMPLKYSSQNPLMQELENTLQTEFGGVEFSWEEIKAELYRAVSSIRVFAVNSASTENLDFKAYEDRGEALTALCVGGFSLSRGLTIEGLTISYMYRNTKMYDTLMQMGRWFGYRFGYEDLCRVYLSKDSIDWYCHIAESDHDLREQIKQMHEWGLSPEEFGLYVHDHPDALMITARNKMRAGKQMDVKLNLSNTMNETHKLSSLDEDIKHNKGLIKEYWGNGFSNGKETGEQTSKGWVYKNIPTSELIAFVQKFKPHKEFMLKQKAIIKFAEEHIDKYPCSDVLLISKGPGDFNKCQLGAQDRSSATLFQDSNLWQMSRYRLASKGDERHGLTEEERALAEGENQGKILSDTDYRKVRNKPLLMIHEISLKDDGSKLVQENVPAYGVSFPAIKGAKSVSVVVNRTYLEHNGVDIDTLEYMDEE